MKEEVEVGCTGMIINYRREARGFLLCYSTAPLLCCGSVVAKEVGKDSCSVLW